MSDYQSGQFIVPPPLTGSELVAIDTGGAEVASCTTQAIADLASLSSNNEQITTISTVGAGVLTAAGITGGIISRTGAQAGSAFSDATATAAAIIAALPAGAPVGTTFTVTISNNTDAAETITAGVGVTLAGNVIIPKLSWEQYLVNVTSAAAVSMTSVAGGQVIPLPYAKVATQAITVSTTIQVTGMTAAQIASLTLTSATAQAVNLALPPAAEVFAAIPNAAAGLNYLLIIRNAFTTTSIATITGSATGVTLSGTATIAQNTSGMFNISIDSPTAYTATRVGP